MFCILCSGKPFKCIFCITEQCVEINVIFKTVDYNKDVRCRVSDHRPRRIRHGGPEDSFIIRQHKHVLHIQKILANTSITLAMLSFA